MAPAMAVDETELDPKLLPVFLAEAAELLPRIDIGLSQIEQGLADTESLRRLQRSLHTLKGTARMTGALALGETVHRIELQAKALAAGEAADAAAMRADYQAALRQIESLPAATMPAEMADDENPEASIESLLGRLQRVADQAALDLRKQAHLQCQDNAVYLERRLLDALAPALEHLVRNAVAHGIELPEQRRELGKPAAGEIVLSSAQSDAGVTIGVADDGAGIAPALLGRIFEAGFSTVQEANQVAGMGIGLDAVRAVVEELGGRVSVQSQPGQGARFSIFLPA